MQKLCAQVRSMHSILNIYIAHRLGYVLLKKKRFLSLNDLVEYPIDYVTVNHGMQFNAC